MSQTLSSYQKYKMPHRFQAGEHSPQFLDDFSKLSPKELYLYGTKNYEALCAWNNLQNYPPKRRNFTFVVPATSADTVIYHVRGGVPKYAFILHDKDDADHDHFHFYIEYPNPRSFASVANDLHMPGNQLQKVIDKAGILKYLTHEDKPDKHHYDPTEIEANFDIGVEIQSHELTVDMIMEEFHDYVKMRKGLMSYEEFMHRHAIQFLRQQFSNRLSSYERIVNAADENLFRDSMHGRACPRAEFLVPP